MGASYVLSFEPNALRKIIEILRILKSLHLLSKLLLVSEN